MLITRMKIPAASIGEAERIISSAPMSINSKEMVSLEPSFLFGSITAEDIIFFFANIQKPHQHPLMRL